jgi:hypothetical protein
VPEAFFPHLCATLERIHNGPPGDPLYFPGAANDISYKTLQAFRWETSLSSIAAAWKRLPWWVEPATVVVALTLFGLYSFIIIAIFPGEFRQFVSPF